MGGLILCGRKAKEPYYIVEAGKNVYTVEELSYYLYNNAYMVGEEFFDDGLISFISDELGMAAAGQRLRYLKDNKGRVKEMITAVLRANSYYTSDEIKEFEEFVENLSDMTPAQRLKSKADGLCGIRKYNSALRTYMNIISQQPDPKNDDSFYGTVWNNMGVVYEKLFLYNEAFNCFKMAADMCPVPDIKERLVMAAILCENEKLIDDVKNRYGLSDDDTDRCRRMLSAEKKRIVAGKEYGRFVNDITFDSSMDMEDYYVNIREMTDRWKDEYRKETG